MNIHSSDELVKQLGPAIAFAAERAWEYAQRVGWDKAYPLFPVEGIVEPLTLEIIQKCYETVIRKLYIKTVNYLQDHPLHPEDRDRLYDSYADFTGTVTFSRNGNPEFRLGLLWAV